CSPCMSAAAPSPRTTRQSPDPSGVEPDLGPFVPAGVGTPEHDAVVLAERAVVPELDARRHDAVAGPVAGARDVLSLELLFVLRDLGLEGLAAFQLAGLRRGPR